MQSFKQRYRDNAIAGVIIVAVAAIIYVVTHFNQVISFIINFIKNLHV